MQHHVEPWASHPACLVSVSIEWNEMWGEPTDPAEGARAAGTSGIYGLDNGRFFTVAWITLHACLKTKEIYIVAVQGPEEISSRVNKNPRDTGEWKGALFYPVWCKSAILIGYNFRRICCTLPPPWQTALKNAKLFYFGYFSEQKPQVAMLYT